MSLRDRLISTTPTTQCLTCRALTLLPKEDATELAAALANPNVTGTTIARALTLEGYPMGEASVQRHRKNQHDAR